MKITVYNTQECAPPTSAEDSALPDLLKADEQVVWVDMTGPMPDDVQVLKDVFQFHPLAIEDTTNQRQRPKVEEYPGYLFSILNTVAWEENEVVFHELDMFVGRGYVVTVHRSAEPPIDEMDSRLTAACSVLPMSVGYLLYVIVDVVVDAYFPILDMIGDEIETIGDTVLERPRQRSLRRLFELKRMLAELWRVAGHQRDMFSLLTRGDSQFMTNESLRFYMRDVYDHLLRISDTINTFRDTVTSVIDLYMSSVSNQLNEQVNRLTIITMGIGVLATISGFYGMNFVRTFPPFESDLGVPFVVVLMVVVIVGVGIVLQRMRKRL